MHPPSTLHMVDGAGRPPVTMATIDRPQVDSDLACLTHSVPCVCLIDDDDDDYYYYPLLFTLQCSPEMPLTAIDGICGAMEK